MGHLLTSLHVPTQVMPKHVPQELTGAVTHNNEQDILHAVFCIIVHCRCWNFYGLYGTCKWHDQPVYQLFPFLFQAERSNKCTGKQRSVSGVSQKLGRSGGVGIKGKGWGEKEFPYLKLLLNLLCTYTFTGSFLLQDSLLAFKGKSLTFLNMYCAHIYGISQCSPLLLIMISQISHPPPVFFRLPLLYLE